MVSLVLVSTALLGHAVAVGEGPAPAVAASR
jgi:hypothetical protein